MTTESEIESRKDKLDLRPVLDFVERHQNRYWTNFRTFMATASTTCANLNLLEYRNADLLNQTGSQVRPTDIAAVISHLPRTIQELSMLEVVDYECAPIVPVPIFEADGFWKKKVDMVKELEFPRPGDHPSRILIGRSTGTVIYPSALPESIHESERNRWFYQLHVFLHEFFHTIELLRRSPESREKIVLENEKGRRFNLQQWWSSWEDMYSSLTMTASFPTRYAATYAESLSQDSLREQPDQFAPALAEQICESFVGYILGIVPNDQDQPDFKKHSPTAWYLIADLATAVIVQK
jgi:hypothetical protein